jgi:hypothetical protein
LSSKHSLIVSKSSVLKDNGSVHASEATNANVYEKGKDFFFTLVPTNGGQHSMPDAPREVSSKTLRIECFAHDKWSRTNPGNNILIYCSFSCPSNFFLMNLILYLSTQELCLQTVCNMCFW